LSLICIHYFHTLFYTPSPLGFSSLFLVYFVLILLPYVMSTVVGWLLQRSFQLSLSAHSCISSTFFQVHPLLSVSLLTWSSHHVHGLPKGLFPLIFIFFISRILLGIQSSPILLTYPNHLSWFLLVVFNFISDGPEGILLHSCVTNIHTTVSWISLILQIKFLPQILSVA
jgi:hypothetical protein